MPVGPELPPHLQKRKRTPESDDDAAVSSPPSKIQALGPEPPRSRPVLGPAPPPASLDERPPQTPLDSDDSSSDDDGYGPSLPPPPGSAAAYEAESQSKVLKAQAEEREKTIKPKREEWMLVPPTDSDWSSRVDPTKLKNRKFQSGKGAKAPAEKSGISAIWTETPEEKRQRLEDEVLGRKDVSTASKSSKPRKDDAEAEATARRIQQYNDKNRNKSLYDEHNKSQAPREKEDDPSARAFDKEKDIGLGGRIGHVQKKDMLKRAGDFGSRFEKGSYL